MTATYDSPNYCPTCTEYWQPEDGLGDGDRRCKCCGDIWPCEGAKANGSAERRQDGDGGE